MTKEQVLQDAIQVGNKYGYISWDGVLDLCDEDSKLVNWLSKQLTKMSDKGEITFELDFQSQLISYIHINQKIKNYE